MIPGKRALQSPPVLSSGTGSRTAGLLKVSDGTFLGGKAKEVSTSKVTKSLSTSNLQDQTSLQVNSGGIKYGSSKIDVKPANQIQATSRSLFEGISKPIANRYKAALD